MRWKSNQDMTPTFPSNLEKNIFLTCIFFPCRFYDELQTILFGPNESEIQEKTEEFTKICQSLSNLKSRKTDVKKLKLRVNMVETLLEQIPQCSMVLALMFSSLEYKRLLLALPKLGYIFEDFSVVFVIVSAMTFWGITSTLLKAK